MSTPASYLTTAIKRFGSEAALGRAIGRSQNAVWHAKRQGRVSAETAIRIHDATDGEVPKWGLRPDLWEPPAASPTPAESPRPPQPLSPAGAEGEREDAAA